MAKLGLNHGLHQRQDMVLAPRMLQAIEVLALPGADLEGWLMEQAEGNEALVVEAPRPELTSDRGVLEPSRSRAAAMRASDDHHALFMAQPDRSLSLSDTVEEQLAARDAGGELREWVRFLVDCLDPSGLLGDSDEELMALAVAADIALAGTESGWSLLGRAIGELQQLEPAGIGARSSVEALLLQLDPTDGDYALLCSLLEDFLFELSRNRRPSVAAKLGLELGELDRLLGVLGQLETRPAAHLTEDAAPTIQPDVMVHKDGELVSVELVRGLLPSVTIDPMAEELLGGGALDGEARGYLWQGRPRSIRRRSGGDEGRDAAAGRRGCHPPTAPLHDRWALGPKPPLDDRARGRARACAQHHQPSRGWKVHADALRDPPAASVLPDLHIHGGRGRGRGHGGGEDQGQAPDR